MRAGGSKAKGSNYERLICNRLSQWVSGGVSSDLFWRSAMSGGRATVSAKRGELLRRQAGDITATAPEGHSLTDRFFIECKNYRELEVDRFLLFGKGVLAEFWEAAVVDAHRHDRSAILIARQDRWPSLVIMYQHDVRKLVIDPHRGLLAIRPNSGRLLVGVWDFDTLLSMTYRDR
jgi:hypothetical protein